MVSGMDPRKSARTYSARMPRLRRATLLALAATTLPVCTAAGGAAVPRTPWLAYGRTPDAQNVSPTPISPAAATALRAVWKTDVGDMITAQPLYAPNVRVGKATRQLLVVASGDNAISALDVATGRVVWRRSLGLTQPQVCGGKGGIESTPVIDAPGRRIFAIGGDGRLVALDLGTGRLVPGWKVPIITRTNVEVVWGALRIAAGSIYVPVASWCDTQAPDGAWDGRLVRVSEKTHQIEQTFDVVPGPKNGGGIWGPGGVLIDPVDGSLWTATANSVVPKDGGTDESAPLGERVVHLTRNLKVLASVPQLNTNPAALGDQGFGSTPVLFKPIGCPTMLAVNSKDSYTYVWRRAAITSAPVLRMKLGESGRANTFYAEPTWVRETRTLVVNGVVIPNGSGANGAVGLRLRKNCTFRLAWSVSIGGGPQPQPLAAGRVTFVTSTKTAKVYAIDSQTGRILRTFKTDSPTYAAPMIAGSFLVLGTADGNVFAFAS
jgi:outer membrane protein assembly factor BamB